MSSGQEKDRVEGRGEKDDESSGTNDNSQCGSNDTSSSDESIIVPLINPQKLALLPGINGTLSTESTCSESTLNSPFVETNRNIISRNNDPLVRNFLFFGGTTVLLLCFFVLSMMSYTTVSLLVMTITSAYFLFTSLYLQIQEHGLLPYLPQSIRDTLTRETSLDEWMRGDDSLKDYRYLLLYFIPGIDLDRMISNLPQRRREQLFERRNIGSILGLGNILFPNRNEEHNSIPLQSVAPLTEDLVWDEDEIQDSPIGLNIEEISPVISHESIQQRNLVAPSSEPTQQDYELEESIVSGALSSAISNAMSSTIESATSFFRRTINMYSPIIIRANVGLLTISSLGLFGLRRNRATGRWSGGRNMERMIVLGMGLNGATLGGFLLLRYSMNKKQNTSKKRND